MPRKSQKLEWIESGGLTSRVRELTIVCQMTHIEKTRVFCYESTGAKTRAVARIWGLSRIWQQTLGLQPAYILEVVSEHFNRLNNQEQDRVLIHELLHIPKNFSGALLPHKQKGGVNESNVWQLYRKFVKNREI